MFLDLANLTIALPKGGQIVKDSDLKSFQEVSSFVSDFIIKVLELNHIFQQVLKSYK